jgi:hypothetical protein
MVSFKKYMLAHVVLDMKFLDPPFLLDTTIDKIAFWYIKLELLLLVAIWP